MPANGELKDPALFDTTDPTTYNRSTSSTIYDSMGQSYKMTTYYLKDSTQPNTWHSYYTVTDKAGEKPVNVTGGDVTAPNGHVGHTIRFNNDGTLSSINNGQKIVTEPLGTGAVPIELNGADVNQQIEINQLGATQFAAPFELTKFNEDGATTGFLTKLDFDEYGSIMGTYSNGEAVTLGRVALVRVPNEQGLDKKGGTQWNSTQLSGDKIWGESNKGSFGSVSSGTLEQSNIDMTQELVDLISAQRNFQANSRSLEVHNGLQQNILQIR